MLGADVVAPEFHGLFARQDGDVLRLLGEPIEHGQGSWVAQEGMLGPDEDITAMADRYGAGSSVVGETER
ncbi:hypothetical protein GCM10009551_060450 [Nocardiopsis tropica]